VFTSWHESIKEGVIEEMDNTKINLHRISLIDKKNVVEDKKAKSLSFFCQVSPVLIDENIISELKEVSRLNNNTTVRVCIHTSPDAEQHDMIILIKKSTYCPPHKHIHCGETYHMIEGEMGVFSFDDNGNVYDSAFLKKSNLYRVAKGGYHAVLPISDYVIFHESRKGPFLGDKDSAFPDWSPEKEDIDEVKAFIKHHEAMLNINMRES
jgi:cupin fold WbuC family metalloprotein